MTNETKNAVEIVEKLINAAYKNGLIGDIGSSATLNAAWGVILDDLQSAPQEQTQTPN